MTPVNESIDEPGPIDLQQATYFTDNETMLWSACLNHCICKGCLVRLATSFGQGHPINISHPMIRCPYPFTPCNCPFTDTPFYFSHASIERILSDEDRELYFTHANRFQFPGFEMIQCPRPTANNMKCGAGILVLISDIRASEPGHLIIQCDQTVQCQRRSCYHCHSLVQRGVNQCEICVAAVENTNPSALNHYFYRPSKVCGDGQSELMRNEEITVEIAVAQIKELALSEGLDGKCVECLTPLRKTEQCNTLEHCGIERCYSCGRSGTRTQKLGDHWDSTGVSGCPRFDHSIFWNVVADCKFRCLEGTCYNDEIGECKIRDHKSGIDAMIAARRKAHILHALKSLLPPIRDQVTGVLIKDTSVMVWLPRFYSSDYRTYLSEPVMRMYIKARGIVDAFENVSEIAESEAPTYEFARDFVRKSAGLLFSMVDAMFEPGIEEEPQKKVLKHSAKFGEFRKKYAPRREAVRKRRMKD